MRSCCVSNSKDVGEDDLEVGDKTSKSEKKHKHYEGKKIEFGVSWLFGNPMGFDMGVANLW